MKVNNIIFVDMLIDDYSFSFIVQNTRIRNKYLFRPDCFVFKFLIKYASVGISYSIVFDRFYLIVKQVTKRDADHSV